MKCELVENRLIVWNIEDSRKLFGNGYYGKPIGIPKPKVEEINVPLILDLIEGLYLLETKKITIYNKKKKTIKRVVETFTNDLFWNDKTLIFEETELSKVIEILIIDYNVEIILSNEKIKHCLLSAKFKNDSIETILNVIAESFKLNITKEENIYIINGDGC